MTVAFDVLIFSSYHTPMINPSTNFKGPMIVHSRGTSTLVETIWLELCTPYSWSCHHHLYCS